MNLIELTNLIRKTLPDWHVTLDEAEMVNITADQLQMHEGFAYIEELNTESVQYVYGRKETRDIDIYFCRFVPLDFMAEQREKVRIECITPAVKAVERALYDALGVTIFTHDKYPRGFDANEVLIHVSFQMSEMVC